MDSKHKCLYCYQELSDANQDYHSACSKKFFGVVTPILLPFRKEVLEELSNEVILRSKEVSGLPAKFSLTIERKAADQLHNYFNISGFNGHFSLKPPVSEIPSLPELEDLTMHLARILQIKTAEHSLIRLESGERVLISQRIDRTKKGKLAMEDMCQLSGTLTEDKYRGSIEKIGKLINQYSSNPGFDVISLFELTLFSFLTGCGDMHLKNFAMLTGKDNQTGFSPAFDLVPTQLVFPQGKDELALSVNGKKKNLTKNDFDSLAEKLKIYSKTLENTYKRFQNNLPKMLDFIDISFLDDTIKLQYKNLIKQRAKEIFNLQTTDFALEISGDKTEHLKVDLIQENKVEVIEKKSGVINMSTGEINDKQKISSSRQLDLFAGF